MTITFKPAKRSGTHLLLGMIGPSGSGKTYSAMMLAAGIADYHGGKFAVIDTEAERALHYAEEFQFDHCDMPPPFSPDAYAERIIAAESAGYSALVIDSASHEHAGEGGLLDWHDQILDDICRRKGVLGTDREYGERERQNMRAWIEPKMSHKRMVSRMLQIRMHLIFCFRAEPKVKMVKNGNRTEIVDAGYQPICAKGLEFEMTTSWLLNHEDPGRVGDWLKSHHAIAKLLAGQKQFSRETGQILARWADNAGAQQKQEQPEAKWDPIAAIEQAQTLDALKEIGARIKSDKSIGGAGIEIVRDAYREREIVLKAQEILK